ncbi:MAG: cysteine hydrolase [Devosia sp.]|nr:cysteine hydrolase [Devosia sp.]
MHKIDIPEAVLARGRQMRGGRDHIFDTIEPAKTAHIVVDLQVGFVGAGAPVEVATCRDMIEEVNAISRAVRNAGGTNVFLRFTYDPGEPQSWGAYYEAYCSPSSTDMTRNAFTRGAPNWELWPALDVAPEDLLVDKTRFSAFIPGTCELDALLKSRGIDTLIITGTLTNCCCESTARDAMQMNYKVIFVSDANAALTDAEHNGTLASMAAIFADVMDTRHLLGVVERSTGAPLAMAS